MSYWKSDDKQEIKIKEMRKRVIKDYICVDLETTGLQAKTEKIIEIGAIKVRDFKVVDTFVSFIYPGKELSPRIIEITKITDEMLKGAPTINEVIREFHSFCEDLDVLGHNILFDYSFLKHAMVNEKLAFEKKGIDTLKIARKYLPDLESRSLSYLTKHFQIEHSKAHRALQDAQATSDLYIRLCEEYYDISVANKDNVFEPKPLTYNAKKQQMITNAQKEQIKRLCETYKFTLDRDIALMSRAEATRWVENALKDAYKLGLSKPKNLKK